MKSMILTILLAVCPFLTAVEGWANSNLHFLTMEDGLAGRSVSKIIQDHQGLTWIAAGNGINTFNGSRLVTFDISVFGKPHNTVGDLCEVAGRRIYAVTRDGIIMMEKGEAVFRPVLADIPNPQCLFADGGNLYIGCLDGLFLYDGKKTKRIPMDKSPVELENSIRKIVKADDGLIYFFSRHAIHSYNPKTGRHTQVNISQHLPANISLGQFAVQNGKIYIGTKNGGVFCYVQRTRLLFHVGEIGNVITSVYNCGNGQICFGTDGSGAYVLDARSDKVVEHYGIGESGKYQIPTNAVYAFYRDRHGVDWFGFSRYGMAYTYHNGLLFKPFSFGEFTTTGMDVRSFCVNGQEVLVGTFHGFAYINRTRNVVKRFEPSMIGGAHIVTCIAAWRGKYYIGTFDGGVKVLDPSSLSVYDQHFSTELNAANIADMKVSADGRLWIGSSNGLYVVSADGRVSHFTEQNSRIIGGIINSITFDGHRNVWLTSKNGLSAFALSRGELVPISFPKGFFNQELRLKGAWGHGGVTYFYNDNEVYHTDATMQKYGTFPLMKKLPGEKCGVFLDNGRGNYWTITEHGLFLQDYALRQLMHFGYGEGLTGELINNMGTDDSGNLWVATSDGLLKADDGAIRRWRNDSTYKVFLYEMSIGGRSMDMAAEYMANDNRHISISWNLWSEELEFVPVLSDYAKPYGRVFEYRLDDDNDWTVACAGDRIRLSGLSLGRHRVCVRLAGALGTAQTYTVAVLPSLPCILELLFMAVAAVLLYLWNRYRKNTNALLSERDEIEGALIELEQTTQQQEQPQGEKYQRMRLDEKECRDIVARMKKYIEDGKLYLHPDLKRTDIADGIGVSPAKLSQVFSLYLKENYYDFVNRYRLEEFKRLVKDDAYKRYTILALSEKCGFKKTSFFSTFRKVEGMTPTEYLKSQNISMKM